MAIPKLSKEMLKYIYLKAASLTVTSLSTCRTICQFANWNRRIRGLSYAIANWNLLNVTKSMSQSNKIIRKLLWEIADVESCVSFVQIASGP